MVDEYLHLVGQKHDNGWGTYLKKGCKQPNVLLTLNRIASSVKDTEANLVHLFQAKDRWVSIVAGGNASDNSSYIVERSQHLAITSRSISDEDLVGVDDDMEVLMQWLEDGGLERSVIALHGMGGLGKTALAANVYKKVREKFECHVWVSISRTYSREDVLRNLIQELFKDKVGVPTDIATMGATGLEETLKGFLEQKKYLIIFDNVWTPEAYNDLFGALTSNLKGSRMIITTRVADVAHLADRILTLEPLSEDASWELFCKKAFPDHECPEELKTLSEVIVRRCKCLPLTIVSIGRLLFMRDKTIDEWIRIHDQLSWEIVNNPRLDHITNVLHVSFINLSTYLKSCFLYCSLFPKDHLFQRKKLVRLWIAEGFIKKRGQSTVEEVEEGYLNELVHRNMLQVFKRNSFGRIKSLRMHDSGTTYLKELLVDFRRRECFGVAYEEDKYGGESLEEDERRLVIHKLKKGSIPELISSAHQLRSVIALDSNMLSSTLLPRIAEKCRYMSVLELIGLPIKKVPDAIGDLFNLRHLGLRGTKVKLLPKSIEKLSNLLTLDVSRSDNDIQELPRGITKLKKLRHLIAKKWVDPSARNFRWGTGVCIPKGLKNLTDLQTLQGLGVQDESVRRLGELRHMRSIMIFNVKGIHCERLCKSLVQMQYLSNLCIAASDEDEVIQLNGLDPPPLSLQKIDLTGRLAEGTLEQCPLFQTAGHHLFYLYLAWSQLREDPLPCLSRLSSLTELWLTRAYSGEQLAFLTGWFPNLKILNLRDLPNLKRLEIQQGAMANLEELQLVNLRSMMEVPPGIEFLMPLQSLVFLEITLEFFTLLRSKIGVCWWYSLRD